MESITENYSKKTGKLSSFRLRADLGRDADGKQIIKTKTIPVPAGLTPARARKAAQDEANEWEKELKKQKKEGLEPPTEEQAPVKTFRQFIEDDFLALHNSGIKPTSREFYRHISVRPIEYFGNMVLSEITPLQIDMFIAHLRTVQQKNGKPLSAKTIRHIYTFLVTAFKFAERYDLITQNPMNKSTPPKLDKKPVDHLDSKEAKAFLVALDKAPLRWQCLMEVLITTGIRRGEAAALMWSDFNFDSLTMKIQRNAYYTPKDGVSVGTPKTESSIREIHILPTVAAKLKQWKAEQAAPHGGVLIGAYSFSDSVDPFSPIRPDAITKWLRLFEDANGLRKVSPHDLRHTAATLLLANGADIKVVQTILGHAESSTTLDFYVAAVKENTTAAIDSYGAALGL